MFRKLFIGFAIAASLSACGANAAQDSPQSSSPQPTQTANNQQVSPSLNTSPSPNPSPNIEAGSPALQAPQASPTPSAQTTLGNSQTASDQTAQAKIWLVPDPVVLYKRLELLNEKLVKGEFETTEAFKQRSEKERKDFERELGVSLSDVFLLKTSLDAQGYKSVTNSPSYDYDADKKVLDILGISPGSTKLEVRITNLIPSSESYHFMLSLDIFPKNAQSNEVKEYWLNKSDKFDHGKIPSNQMLIPNIEPSYAKDLIEQKRIFFEYFFTNPDAQGAGISGKLVKLKLVDSKTGNVLWSLN